MLARLLLAVASGLSLWVAFPSHGLWPMAVLGCAGLALATCQMGPWRGALVGLLGGLACFVPLLSWSGVYVGALPWLALASLESLYVAGFGLVCGYLQRTRVRPLAVGLAWTVGELARSTTPFGGFPWGRLAFSQAESPMLGAVALLGSPGLSFLVAFSGGLLAYAGSALLTRRRQHAIRGAVALAGVAACVTAPLAVPRPVDGEPVQVLAVQGNVPEMSLEFNAQRREVLDRHAATTERAAERIATGELPRPDVVLWPENSADIDPTRNADAAAVIEAAMESVGVPLVVGALLREPVDHNSNAALLYVPGQGIADRYVKRRPAPFAEYIPYRSFFRVLSDKVDLVPRDFVAGSEVGLLQVPLRDDATLPVGVAICFEVVIDDVMRDTVRAGAELILVPTNNATFGFTDESVQQLAASRVKSVELGRAVVHISTVGVSALITPDARVHQRTELFTQDVLSGTLPRRTELTWAVRLGPWPEGVAAVALVLLVAGTALTNRRAGQRPADRPPG